MTKTDGHVSITTLFFFPLSVSAVYNDYANIYLSLINLLCFSTSMQALTTDVAGWYAIQFVDSRGVNFVF